MKISFVLAATAASVSGLVMPIFTDSACTIPYGNQVYTAYDNVCLPYDATPYIIESKNATHARIYSYWNATFPPDCVKTGARNPDWQWPLMTVPLTAGACAYLYNDEFNNNIAVYGKVMDVRTTAPNPARFFRYALYAGPGCAVPAVSVLPAANPPTNPFAPQTQWVPVDTATETECSLWNMGTGDNFIAYSFYNARVQFRSATLVNVTLYGINPNAPTVCADALIAGQVPDLRIDGSCQNVNIGGQPGSIRVWPVRDNNNRNVGSGASAVGTGMSSVLAASLAMVLLAKMRE